MSVRVSRCPGAPTLPTAFLALATLWPPGEAFAQQAQEHPPRRAESVGWNSPRALAVAKSAVDARHNAATDTALHSFTAQAEGHVYFLGELAGERQLARADEVALRIYWEAPSHALQAIVGRRHAKRLPTDIQYHIDHLSVVLDNFNDEIRLGEGDEIRNVLHPAALAALRSYEYRLEDSLEIRIRDQTVRVYRLLVRPVNLKDPGVVGTMYVERGSGAIARMALTFTSAAYVDPSLDYIRVDLRSALWEGQHWLPAEQDVEIRRQVSWLSFPVGGIIRTHFRIFNYQLNRASPVSLSPGHHVASLPAHSLRSYREWKLPLEGGPLAEGERSDDALTELQGRAQEIARPRDLVGTSRLQLYFPNTSGVMRARRAEGALTGSGARYRLDDRSSATLWFGYPFERQEPELYGSLRWKVGALEVRGALFVNRLADAGPYEASSGTLATLALVFRGEDYTDPFFEDGGKASLTGNLLGGQGSLAVVVADQSSAELLGTPVNDRESRPVRLVDDGTAVELLGSYRRSSGRPFGVRWSAGLELRGATDAVGDFGYTRFLLDLAAAGSGPARGWSWRTELAAGIAGGRLPAQRLLLVGGRNTVPGYEFRGWGGDRAVWTSGEMARDVLAPWFRLHATASAGWTDLTDVAQASAVRFGASESGGVRPAAGFGASFLYSLIRFDAARGLDGGEWVFFLSLRRSFWPIL